MITTVPMNSFVITRSGIKRVHELETNEKILGINTNGKEEWAEIEIKDKGYEDCYLLYGDCFYGVFHKDSSIFTTTGQKRINAILNNHHLTKVEYLRNISEKDNIMWQVDLHSPLLEAVLLRVKKIDSTSNTIVLAVPTPFYESKLYDKHIKWLCKSIKGEVLESVHGSFWSWVNIKLHNSQCLLDIRHAYKGHPDWLTYYLELGLDGKIDSIIEEDDIHFGIIFGLILKGLPFKISYSPLYSPIDINFTINENKLPYSNIKSIIVRKNESTGLITNRLSNWYPIVNFIPIC